MESQRTIVNGDLLDGSSNLLDFCRLDYRKKIRLYDVHVFTGAGSVYKLSKMKKKRMQILKQVKQDDGVYASNDNTMSF